MKTQFSNQSLEHLGRRPPGRGILARGGQQSATQRPIKRCADRNRCHCYALAGAFLLTLLLASAAHAQQYAIPWFKIAGGGAMQSTGGVYAVSGTIGQPDAGTMSGGNFAVKGGFWAVIAVVQTPGAPLLTIVRTTTNTVAVSWPSPSTGYQLQQNTNGIALVNWSNVVTLPTDDGTTKTVIVSPPTGDRYYRLFKP